MDKRLGPPTVTTSTCLNDFHQRCLRTALKIPQSDSVANVEVLDWAETSSIEALILIQSLRWAGHVHIIENHWLLKIDLNGEVSNGQRKRGSARKQLNVSLKKSLYWMNIDHRALPWPSWWPLKLAQYDENLCKTVWSKQTYLFRKQARDGKPAADKTGSLPQPCLCRHCSRPYLSPLV